jgi:hypothetical protein
LDLDHSLALYNQANQWKVWLNPNGSSIFQNSLTVNGNNNLMPNQTLSGDGSVLTRKLGDVRYVVKGTDKTSLGYATATGYGATAFGGDSWATGWGSIAGGGESMAYGDSSIALGEASSAHTWGAIALGRDAHSYGIDALAVGLNAKAYGLSSSAIGSDVQSSGNYASAFGLGTIAQSYGQTVLGRYNVAQGNSSNWVATDDLFVVGNGTSNNQRSNAFTVKKNGDAVVKGNATVQGYSYFNDINTDNLSAGGDVMVSGVTEMMGGAYVQGAAHVQGDLQVTGKINVTPQGDLGMGTFK